jgi:hypothetical protein
VEATRITPRMPDMLYQAVRTAELHERSCAAIGHSRMVVTEFREVAAAIHRAMDERRARLKLARALGVRAMKTLNDGPSMPSF